MEAWSREPGPGLLRRTLKRVPGLRRLAGLLSAVRARLARVPALARRLYDAGKAVRAKGRRWAERRALLRVQRDRFTETQAGVLQALVRLLERQRRQEQVLAEMHTQVLRQLAELRGHAEELRQRSGRDAISRRAA